MTRGEKPDIILGMLKKGLVEVGGLESEILELERNGSEGGFVGEYDGDEFYYKSDRASPKLSLSRDNPVVLLAFKKYLKKEYGSRRISKNRIVYQWR